MDDKIIEQKLLEGNKRYLSEISANPSKKSANIALIKKQEPYALIVCCSDSCVVPEEIFSIYLGELFVIRTAGNVINEGELASIEYGLAHLNIKYVLVLGHTHCGAVHAAIHNEKGEYLALILDNISKSICGETNEFEASKKNAIKQIEYIKAKFPSSNATFKAAVYNIEDGKVSILN